MNRVVVTGLGVFSSLGRNAEGFQAALKSGRSAIAPLTIIRTEGLLVKIGAEIPDFDPNAHFDDAKMALMDRFTQLAMIATREAVADSGLSFRDGIGMRTAAVVGSGVGGQSTLDDNYYKIYAQGQKRLHPFTIPKLMINAPVSHITMEHGITGPSFTVASACSSANHAIGVAYHMVRSGMVDVAVTGGTEATITYGTMKGWEALRVMAPDTCRPFCRDRKGMVLGEGAAIMVIENLDHAKARGARIHAEIAGFGMSSDAGDIVLPSATGAAQAMRACLEDGRIDPEAVGYINAHGTGTTANDVTETKAIHLAFGAHAKRLAVSSTKSLHGHALGGAGAIELAATIVALRDGFIPPTANFTEADPQCDLDYVPNEARAAKVDYAISNSFAFGGHNAVVAVRRFSG
ncbi:MAG TPA: beta-ketoacyl-[acyl-carrier-protein] synthase family protein [Alphaproteobacteria bacterium]|nr:beta-ketoacyl-[acyl-carrier-protein] synthase family protein [Alphaproteobacteria bacterium]